MKIDETMRALTVAIVAGILIFVQAEDVAAAFVRVDRDVVTMDNGRLELAYDLSEGTFSVKVHGLGTVLQNGKAFVKTASGRISSADEAYANRYVMSERQGDSRIVKVVHRSDSLPTMVVGFEMSPSRSAKEEPQAEQLEWSVAIEGNAVAPLVSATLTAEESAFACRANLPPGSQDNLLPTAIGRPESGVYTGFFDRRNDFAVELRGKNVKVSAGRPSSRGRSFSCVVEGDTGELLCYREFLKRFRNLPYYKPFSDKPWGQGIAGYCSWYFYYTKVSEEDMLKETDWMAEHMKPYGLEYILMDDGWQTDVWTKPNEKFPHGLKWLNDHIHQKGLKAALWLTPFALSSEAILKEHPDWFVKDANGKYVSTFKGKYCIDPTHPEVLGYLREMARTFKEWDYDYLKLDGLPAAEANFAKHRERLHEPGASPAEAFRRGLQAIRDVFGWEKILNGCWGTPTDAFGIVNASRIGGDVGGPGWDGVLGNTRQMCRWMYVHNIAWVNDPDCSCVRPPLTPDQARARVSAFALTGGVFLGSDQMFSLPGDRVEIFRRALPVAEVWPRDMWSKPHVNVWDLKVRKPFGSWDIVGLFNWTRRGAPRTVIFDEIGLSPEQPYVLYDYWEEDFIGPVRGSYNCVLPPTSCRVLSVHTLKEHPFLVSTSRHVTQGAVDLLDVKWDADSKKLIGRSLVVKDDPYVLRIVVPPEPITYRFLSARANGAAVSSEARGFWLNVALLPSTTGELKWEVAFEAVPARKIVLSPPRGLSIESVGEREAELSWEEVTEGAVGYVLFRNEKPIATVPRAFYHDSGLKPDSVYRYQVAAVDWSGRYYGSKETVEVRTKTPPPRPPLPEVSLSELKPVRATQGWGALQINANCTGKRIIIEGEVFKRGLGTHAVSEIVYKLEPRFARFVAVCGLDDSAGSNGSIRFRVLLDGKELLRSPLITSGERKAYVDVPIEGGKELTLVVDDADDGIDFDHADWAEAGFVYQKKE
ncbi:NPCBM/NEW2 domain-containing protein [bacterium]|nr:NPCBM/NEW2 domain-containing protein [bacterium]